MDWINCTGSSSIARYAYDVSTQILTVEFIRGETYNYFDVPENVYEEMKTATSKGKFISDRIKGYYRYARA